MLDKDRFHRYNVTVDNMIKINVAEIKKRLVGSESFQYDLVPAQLNLSPEDADLEGHILVEGENFPTGEM